MKETMRVDLQDRGRPVIFAVTPMRALPLEIWMSRVAKALPPGTIPPVRDATDLAQAIVNIGIFPLGYATGDQSDSILESLLECCAVVDPETGAHIPCTSQNIDEHITDVVTLISLRRAALMINLSFTGEAARKNLALPSEAAYRRSLMEYTPAQSANLPPVMASLLIQGLASLQDLRTTYTFPDALDLLEIGSIRSYNQWAARESAKRRTSR